MINPIDDHIPVFQSPTNSQARAIPINNETIRMFPMFVSAERSWTLTMSTTAKASSNPNTSNSKITSTGCCEPIMSLNGSSSVRRIPAAVNK